MVAPANYQRPSALVTKAMIQRAEKKVEELGFMAALQRRYAVTEDITVNNVLFADRSAKKHMKNAFEQLADDVGERVNPKHLEKVEEVPIDKFIENVLPKALDQEVFVAALLAIIGFVVVIVIERASRKKPPQSPAS